MAKRLFVGNISWKAQTANLRELFERYGEVSDAIVLEERDTGRSKGFGFIEFVDDDAADAAITALDGVEFMGRELVVNEARPKEN
jgi:RNA recognition motif-containing protein